MKAGHLKVLAKDSTSPYFSINCPCQPQVLTGHYFADYVQYNMFSDINLEAYETGDKDSILETDQYSSVNNVNPNWKPSAVLYPQTRFYRSYVNWSNNGVDSLWYRTRQLTETESSFLLTIPLFKENRWWNKIHDYYSIVSGNSTSAVYDCYDLSTCVTTLEFSKNHSSGFISSIILNNFDNTFKVEDFITVSSLNPFAISATSYYPAIDTNYITTINYVPVTKPCQTAVQYYLSRIFKGDQEGYVFTSAHPTDYYTSFGYYLIGSNILAGADNVPVSGKEYYFYNYDYSSKYIPIRKIDNRFFGYSTRNYKSVIEYPASSLQSAVLQYDDASQSILKITTGLMIVDEDQYYYTLLSTFDGILSTADQRPIDNSYLWTNYTGGPYNQEYIKCDLTGQFYYFALIDSEQEYIDDITYYWDQYVCFPKEYSTATSTAIIDVYKFGYYYDLEQSDWVYTSSFVAASTTIITAKIDTWPPPGWDDEWDGEEEIEPPPQPQVQWDSELSCFYYIEGGGEFNHPDYMNYSFVLTTGLDGFNRPISTTFYVYKAPMWGVLQRTFYQNIWETSFIVTGSNWNDLHCLSCNQAVVIREMPISTGWWIPYGSQTYNYYLPCLSAQDYWYVPSTYELNNQQVTVELPLTGGDVRSPQKSVAADDPNRPPYWYFYVGDENFNIQKRRDSKYSEVGSGKYIVFPKGFGRLGSIGLIVPIYYDTFYGNIIEPYGSYFLDDSYGITEEYYYQAKEMVNNHSYDLNKNFVCPFINYVATRYHYDSDDYNPTIQQFINPRYYRDWTPIETAQSGYLFSETLSVESQRATWGGGYHSDSGQGYDYQLITQKFVKMTQSEISDYLSYYNENQSYAIDPNLSTALPFIDGLYCQILTGFWIQQYNDYYNGPAYRVCGIRKHGYFNQLLQLDKEYHFGYDLSTVALLDNLLSADDSVCYTLNNSNQIVSTTVADYWNNKIKNHLQPNTTISNMNYHDFYTLSHIRVISAHYTMPVQD